MKFAEHIGPQGRWLIFSGFYFCILHVLFVLFIHRLEKAVSQKLFPYALLFIAIAIGIGCSVIYERVSAKSAFVIGIMGWIIALSVGYWYWWFGPGAFRM
jgi:hypothetical protein